MTYVDIYRKAARVLKYVCLMVLTAVGLELAIFTARYTLFSFVFYSVNILTLWTLWTVGALAGIVWVLVKRKVDPSTVVVALLVTATVSGLAWDSVPDDSVQSFGTPRYLALKYYYYGDMTKPFIELVDLRVQSIDEHKKRIAEDKFKCGEDCVIKASSNLFFPAGRTCCGLHLSSPRTLSSG